MRPILIVPGYRGSGPEHWQTHFEETFAGARRVAMPSFDEPERSAWVDALERAVASCERPPVLVAHSLGCIAVAHWASASRRPLRGALLVAPCDVEKGGAAAALRGFAPLPSEPFGFPARVVASTDDPYLDLVRAQSLAFSWGARLRVLEGAGHINVEAGFGPWPEGEALLGELL